MPGLLFVSQDMLDAWAEQGRIDLQGDVLTVLAGAGEGRRYALNPAVRFLRVIDATSDPLSLVGRVKTSEVLRELKAEQLGDSVLVGDTAYEVQPGFVADVVGPHTPEPIPAPQPVARPAKPRPAGGAPARTESEREAAEALMRFFLEKLS